MSGIFNYIDMDTATWRTAPVIAHKLNRANWALAVEQAAAQGLSLFGLWGAKSAVTLVLLDATTGKLGVLRCTAYGGRFPSVGQHFPSTGRLERSINDLFGLSAEGAPDTRPWLDHGNWAVRHPLGKPSAPETQNYTFLPVEGEGLHQVPVGPVHAGIIEPGHFRFTGQGETVVRLEERLGYTHKGIEALMQGASIKRGSELAARTCGDSTVAYGWAYAQAVESAFGVAAPARAEWIRAILAELERLANHLGDIGGICNDAGFALMLARCSSLRERVLRAANIAFGHRFMRDCIQPGGVASDLSAVGIAELRRLLADLGQAFPSIIALYDGSASLHGRTVGTGFLSADLARSFAAGGFIGRASGRDFDTRRALPYGPYGQLKFEVPCREEGDVDARIWIRIHEVEQSLSLLSQLIDALPMGEFSTDLPKPEGRSEGLGIVEGFRGDILAFVALDARGRIARCHLRDPSWFQWPLLEAVVEDNIIADFPLCNKSFNCSYSGHDL